MPKKPIEIQIHEITDPKLLAEFDPKRIVGLISPDQKSLSVAYLSELVSLSEKVRVRIPAVFCGKNAHPTVIGNIQIRKDVAGHNFALNEIIGPINPTVFSWITAITANMQKIGLVNAFFPAYKAEKEESRFLYGIIDPKGSMMSAEIVLDEAVKNIRLTQGNMVFFTVKEEVRRISFKDISKKDWLAHSWPVTSYKADIVFLGRPNRSAMTVVLSNGETHSIGLGHGGSTINVNGGADNKFVILEPVSSLLSIGAGIIAAVSQEKEDLFLYPESTVAVA